MSVSAFARDVLVGLKSNPKYLLSKYFYDKRGSEIFQDIMRMPEYYLTDCELEIFNNQKHSIFNSFIKDDPKFDLIELGAGDGLKTKVLLNHFYQQKADFTYIPIDISEDYVNNLTDELKEMYPEMRVDGMIGDYFYLLDHINENHKDKKILLFLGSTIGNFEKQDAKDFLVQVRSVMRRKDMLFIGFDLKKDPRVIIRAYNDPHGHTAAFNLNLLKRINRELDANFNLNAFDHHEIYDPESGAAKSFLISKTDQEVYLRSLEAKIPFAKSESIYMEISKKFDLRMIRNLAEVTGFEIVSNFLDSRQYFVNSLWRFKA